jgi:hypothetical protein
MAPPPLSDLTQLLAEVASRLSRPPGGESLSASISSLAAALNPGAPASGTRVLDAALSLMCFDPQEAIPLFSTTAVTDLSVSLGWLVMSFSLQVDRARLDYLVRTIVSALSDSVSCRVVRTDERIGGEMLCVGSSVSPRDCRELVRSCAALAEKLGNSDGEIPNPPFFLSELKQ